MQQNATDVESVFSRSWTLLRSNWIIIVPGLVVAVVVGIVLGFLAISGVIGGVSGGGAFAFAFAGALAMLVAVLGTIISVAYTTGMAGAAWERGVATFADGAAAFRRDGAQTFLAIVLLFLLGIVAALLSVVSFGLAMLAYAIFVIYTLPGVIVGDRPAMDAIKDSFNLAAKNFVPTLIIVVLIAVISVIGGLIGGNIYGFVGRIISAIIQQAIISFATLVIVGEYIKLRSTINTILPPTTPPS